MHKIFKFFSSENITSLKEKIVRNKIKSAIILVIILIAIYATYNKLTSTSGETRYVLGEAVK